MIGILEELELSLKCSVLPLELLVAEESFLEFHVGRSELLLCVIELHLQVIVGLLQQGRVLALQLCVLTTREALLTSVQLCSRRSVHF